MATFGNFTLSIENFKTKANQRTASVIKRVLADIFRDLVLETPRATGFAQYHWGVGSAVPELDPSRGGPGPYPSPVPQGVSVIKGLQIGEGLVCYMYNNCRYIRFLEFGSATIAPAAMVRTVLTRFQNYVANAAATKG